MQVGFFFNFAGNNFSRKITRMNRFIAIPGFLLCLLFAFSAYGQDKSPVLIKFKNGEKVYKDEFEYVYQKNNGGYEAAANHTDEQYQEYLELYVTFKRKVMEAKAKGLDTTRSFKAELETYLKQLARPYLIEQSVLDSLILEAWEHSNMAVSVSHILLRMPKGATPEDTLSTYKRIIAIRDSILNGADFGEMALRHSEDPSAKDNEGFLSYFTAFDFVYPFESAAFNANEGDVTQPVRSRFGYHILKVHDKVEAKGNYNAYHILVRSGPTYEAKDSLEAKKRAEMIYEKIKNGADFEETAKEYSDDPNTKSKGGELGVRYLPVPEIQSRKYLLKDGEVSKPFESDYGWHIVKVKIEEKDRTFEDVKKLLKNRVTRDKRASIAEDKLIARLRKEYDFQYNERNKAKFIASVGEAYKTGLPQPDSISSALPGLELFSYADQSHSVEDFLAFLPRIRGRSKALVPAKNLFEQELETFANAMLLDYEEMQLAKKYPEYRFLRNEYRDGILLFTLTEQMVWKKAVQDTAGLEKFYEKNKEKFPAGERVRVREYRSSSKESIEVIDSLYTAHDDKELVDSLARAQGVNVRISRQVIEKEKPEAKALYARKVGFVTKPEQDGRTWHIRYIEEFLPKGVKSLEEARAELITQYQNQLEEEWVEKLEKKYKYSVVDKTFENLFEE